MTSKDFYQILGLDEKAAEEQIKAAFRKLAKTYHPDRNPGDKEAEERFKEITEAYDVLSTPQKRRQYDQMRKYGAYGPFTGADRGAYNPYDFGRYGSPGQTHTWSTIDDADLGTFGGLGDIFEELLRQMGVDRGGRSRDRTKKRAIRGEDIRLSLEIPFDLAIKGGRLVVKVPGKTVCPACGGTGSAPGGKVNVCRRCKGSGTVAYQLGGYALSRTCPECLGKGTRPEKPCPQCGGLGFSRGERKVGIKVPAGVADKTKLKIASQGEAGDGGAPAGDLYITIRVSSDKEFTRRGDNICTVISIDLDEAMGGTTKDIPTVTGKKVRLKIPAKTPPGKVFRLKGQGVHNQRRQRTGDHLVTVEVKMPRKLTKEQREFLEGFSKK